MPHLILLEFEVRWMCCFDFHILIEFFFFVAKIDDFRMFWSSIVGVMEPIGVFR